MDLSGSRRRKTAAHGCERRCPEPRWCGQSSECASRAGIRWGGRAKINEDFEKLVVSRAELRVMVCSAESLQGVNGHFDRLSQMIGAFRSNQHGDRYLFAGWYGKKNTPGQLVFKSHVVGQCATSPLTRGRLGGGCPSGFCQSQFTANNA
jgi:hypothetical protein